MPSPVGHALGAVAVGWVAAGRAGGRHALVRQVAILAAIGMAPDLDFLIGRHGMETHSIGAAVLAGAVAAWRRWPVAATRARIFVVVALAWLSHPVFDMLAVDTSPPLGVMFLWPLSTGHMQTGWAVFTPISRRYWVDGFMAYTALAVLREVLILAPWLYLGSRRVRRTVGGLTVALVAIGLLLGTVDGAARQATPPQQQPTFRAGAHFVRVDAYPVRDGRIVRGLTVADFEVLEDGRPQTIESIEFVEFPAWTPEGERRDPNSVQEGFRLAADPRYRVFVVYYDVHHVPVMAATRLRRPLVNMFERLMGPRDMVAFLTPRQSPDALTFGQRTFTLQRQLDRILEANTAGAELHDAEEAALFVCFPWMSEDELKALIRVRRTEKVYRDLDALAVRLGALREERKNIVVLSSNLTAPPLVVPDRERPRTPAVGTNPMTGRLGLDPRTVPYSPDRRWCDDELGRARQFEDRRARRDLVQAARLANVAIYTVSPVGLGGENVGEPGYDLMGGATSSLLEIASGTDALSIVATNDLDAGLGRIVEDVAAYYTLGYYTTNSDWNGGVRRLEVRLKPSGERVRARREYRAPTAAEMAGVRAAGERPAPGGTGAVAAALGTLARLTAAPSLFVRGLAAGGQLYVAVELPALGAGTRSAGADVHVEATPAGGGDAAAGGAAMAAGRRSTLVTLDVTGDGPWQVAVTVTGGGRTLRERIEIAGASTGWPETPLLFRATPSPRSPLLPAAEPLFPRTERVHLEWLPDVPVPQPAARLLNTKGEPLAVPIALVTREDAGRLRLVADLTLAPLAPGDYVIELRPGDGSDARRSLTAIRVVR